jgi:hypothetical protein
MVKVDERRKTHPSLARKSSSGFETTTISGLSTLMFCRVMEIDGAAE